MVSRKRPETRNVSTEDKRRNEGTQILQLHETLIHVAAVQTCGSSENARLARCSAVRHCACSVLCMYVCVYVNMYVCMNV